MLRLFFCLLLKLVLGVRGCNLLQVVPVDIPGRDLATAQEVRSRLYLWAREVPIVSAEIG